MAENAGIIVAKKAAEIARKRLVDRHRDLYNEDEIKERILSEMEQIKDDTTALRQEAFKSAHHAMEEWHESPEAIGSEMRKELLRQVMSNARKGFSNMADPIDKICAVGLLIYASYHYAALTAEGGTDWRAGKRTAQQLLRQYSEKLRSQLESAAEEEIRRRSRVMRALRNSEKRRALLKDFSNLSASVAALRPMGMNDSHPSFEEMGLEDAIFHAIDKKPYLMWPVAVNHMILEPMERLSLKQHSKPITCCCVSEDSKTLVSGSEDKSLKVWDISNCELEHILPLERSVHTITTTEHKPQAPVLMLDPDSGQFKLQHDKKKASSEEIVTKNTYTAGGHSKGVTCSCFFLGNSRLVSGSDDQTLLVWDVATGDENHELRGHTGGVLCCQVYEYGTMLVSGSHDKTLRVWDLRERHKYLESIHTLEGHFASVSCCQVLENNNQLVSGSWDRTLKLWDLTSGEVLHTLQGHKAAVLCCSAYNDGKSLVSGSKDKTLKVWDLATCKEIRTLEGHTNHITCCRVFGGDAMVISSSHDCTLKIWDLATGEETHTLKSDTGSVFCCSVFADDTRVISGDVKGQIKIWDLPLSLLQRHKQHKE